MNCDESERQQIESKKAFNKLRLRDKFDYSMLKDLPPLTQRNLKMGELEKLMS